MGRETLKQPLYSDSQASKAEYRAMTSHMVSFQLFRTRSETLGCLFWNVAVSYPSVRGVLTPGMRVDGVWVV